MYQVIQWNTDALYHDDGYAQAKGCLDTLGNREECTHPEEIGQGEVFQENRAEEDVDKFTHQRSSR
jgi:hypothetical protein